MLREAHIMSAWVNRLRRPTPALRLIAIVTSLALAGMPIRAQAQANLPLIRDAKAAPSLRPNRCKPLALAKYFDLFRVAIWADYDFRQFFKIE